MLRVLDPMCAEWAGTPRSVQGAAVSLPSATYHESTRAESSAAFEMPKPPRAYTGTEALEPIAFVLTAKRRAEYTQGF